MRILVIEDEEKVSGSIKRGLETERFTVETSLDGEQGYRKAVTGHFDAIILDLMLPKRSGFTVLRMLREQEIVTPVLILSAKGDIDDKIHGLNLGADDYLVKPFSFGELLARVRALLRRTSPKSTSIFTIGTLEVNLVAHEVMKDGELLFLTTKEYALLDYFISNIGRVLDRVSIAEHVWKHNFDTGTNYIDVYVNRLRKKLENDSGERIIETVRGYGYIMKNKTV